jgi:hypothetical protein
MTVLTAGVALPEASDARACPVPGGLARPSRLLRPQPPPRSRAVHPVPASHHRRAPRRAGQAADRAGARVPAGGDLRRSASRPAAGHPGRRGQELLLPSGVDYGALPRVVRKTAARSLGEWRNGDAGLRLLLPQGGSTLTQQLVRCSFLQDLTSRPDGDVLFRDGIGPPGSSPWPWAPRPRTSSCQAGGGAPDALARGGDAPALRLAGEGQAGDLSPLRELHLPGNGRYGFAARSEVYIY